MGKKIYRVVRWLVLLALIVAVLLMLKRPAPAAGPLSAAVVAQKSTEFNAKLEGLRAAAEHEDASEASFSSDEVNSFIADSTVRAAQLAAGGPQPVKEDAE